MQGLSRGDSEGGPQATTASRGGAVKLGFVETQVRVGERGSSSRTARKYEVNFRIVYTKINLRRAEKSNEHGVRSVLVQRKGSSWQQASLELEAVDGADAYFDFMLTYAHLRTPVETHEGQK